MVRKALAAFVLVSSLVTNYSLSDSGAFPLLAPEIAEAAHAEQLVCDQPTGLQGTIHCRVKLVKPVGDSGATHVHLGVHYPLEFSAGGVFTNFPGMYCFEDVINGHKRINCKNFPEGNTQAYTPIPEGAAIQVDFDLNVAGQCGTTVPVNATVANVYGVNSPVIYYNLNFPACSQNVAGCGGTNIPSTVHVGQQFAADVNFSNLGTTSWLPVVYDVGLRRGNDQADDLTWGGMVRTHIPRQVDPFPHPSHNITVRLAATAPSVPGTYPFNASVLQNNVEWFGATCSQNITVLPALSLCGNGLREGNEECDDGNAIQTDACVVSINSCLNARCGDGFVRQGIEQCDEGIHNGQPGHCNVACTGTTPSQIIATCPNITVSKPTVAPGEHLTVTATFRNSGNIPWLKDGVNFFKLGDNNIWQIPQTDLPQSSVAPDATVTFIDIPAVAPSGPLNISHDLHLAMYQHGQGGLGWVPGECIVPVRIEAPLSTVDLSISKSKVGQGTTVNRGSTILYNLHVENAQNSITATNVTVADPIPSGLLFNPAQSDPNCLREGNDILCNNVSIAAGQFRDFRIAFDVPQIVACNSQIQNAAAVSTSQTDRTAANNQSNTVLTTVACPVSTVNLALEKTAPATVERGANITYTLAVTGLPATNVVVTDPIPGGLTYLPTQSSANCTQQGFSIRCANVTSTPLSLTFRTATSLSCGTSIPNEATVSSQETDTHPANNTDSVITTVTCPAPVSQCSDQIDNDGDGLIDFGTGPTNDPGCTSSQDNDEFNAPPPPAQADLRITKTGPSSPVVRNNGIASYTLTVSNNGPADAQNVVITDPVPTGLLFDRAEGMSCGLVANGEVRCDPFTMAANATPRSVTLIFKAPPVANCVAINIGNIAHVASSTPDPIIGNNDSNAVTATLSCPVVTPQCSDQSDNADPEDTVADQADPGCHIDEHLLNPYDPTDTNEVHTPRCGNAFPEGTEQCDDGNTSNTDACVGVCRNAICGDGFVRTGTETCDEGSQNGQSGHCNLSCTGTVPFPQCSDQIDNDGDGLIDFPADPGCASLQDNDEFNLPPPPLQADLRITKTGPPTIQRGSTITYTLTAINDGPDTATNITLADPIPAGLTFVPQQGCVLNAAGTSVLCNNFPLTAGQTRAFTLTFQTASTLICGNPIENHAAISSSITDPNAANNQSGVVSTTVTCPPPPTAQCADGVDNADPEDTVADQADPGCHIDEHLLNPYDPTDTNEVHTPRCGNAFPEGTEQCDDGNTSNTDACVGVCRNAICGDGFVRTGTETCDEGSQNGQSGHCNLSCTGTVPFPQCSDQIDNDGDGLIDFPADPGCASLQDNDEFNTPLGANLSLAKVTQTPSIVRGSNVVYELRATNAGPGAATNVLVTDLLPSTVTFVSASGTGWQCTTMLLGNSTQVRCGLASLASGLTTQPIQLTVHVPAVTNCAPLQLTNTASVSASESDSNPLDNVGTAVTTVTCPPPPTAQCADGVDNADPEDTVADQADPGCHIDEHLLNPYDPTDTNEVHTPRCGNAFPEGTEQCDDGNTSNTDACVGVCRNAICGDGFVRTGTETCDEGSQNGQSGHCNLSCTGTVPFPQCSDQIDNDGDGLIDFPADPGCASLQDNDEFNLPPPPLQADLRITKTGPSSISRGTPITYTLTAFNDGPDTATNVVVADLIPAGLTFVSAPGCVLNANGTSVLCNNFPLTSGQSRPFTLTFQTSGTVCNGEIENHASVSSSITDPNSANNQSPIVRTLVTCPVANADLSLSKSTPNDSIQLGGVITYTLIALNNGPATASNVSITDTLPQGVTLLSSPGCTAQSSTLTCSVGSLNVSSTSTFTVTVRAPTSSSFCSQTLTNTASVTGSETDPSSSNSTSSAVTAITCAPAQADLSVQKTAPSSVVRGGFLDYTVTITNAGPSTETANVVLTDSIPAGLTFNASRSNNNCTQQGNNVVCAIGLGGPNLSFPVAISFNVPLIDNCTQTSVTNTASVTSQLSDSNTGNNQATSNATTITCPLPTTADISLTKDAPDMVSPGDIVRYDIVLANGGPANATNVLLRDSIPSGLTATDYLPAESSTGCRVNGTSIECGGSDLLLIAGGRRTFTIAFRVPADVSRCGTTLTNEATVQASESDARLTNNTSGPVTTRIECAPADVSITKSAPDMVSPGDILHYDVVVTNTGPGIATNVLITDPIPSPLTAAAFLQNESSTGCRVNGTSIECGGGDLSLTNGTGRRTFTIAFRVPSGAGVCGTILTNEARVQAREVDPRSENNVSGPVVTTIACAPADVSVAKSAPTSVRPGEKFLSTITVTNTGPGVATNVRVTDAIPSSLTASAFLQNESSIGCRVSGTSIECGGSDLLLIAGGRRTFTIALRIPENASCETPLASEVRVQANEVDPRLDNNQSSVSAALSCNP